MLTRLKVTGFKNLVDVDVRFGPFTCVAGANGLKEELVHINLGDAKKNLLFPHSVEWRKSAIRGRRTSPFISTEDDKGKTVIKLHQDGIQGKPLYRLAVNLPRTVLSVANADVSPTVLLARREMQSWQLLQLEPSALRQPDEFTSPTKLDMNGSHLAATLYYLARFNKNHPTNGLSDDEAEAQVYQHVANRLAELIDDVSEVGIDRDERRELLTLIVTGRDGTSHPARALSDGKKALFGFGGSGVRPTRTRYFVFGGTRKRYSSRANSENT